MAIFSENSKKRLTECDEKIQRICNVAIKEIDFSILCGYRGKVEQEKAFSEGKSKAKFGQSKHNFKPSLAVDIAPSPLDWSDIDSFKRLAVVIKRISTEMNIKIVWGGDFKSLKDYPHFELSEETNG